MSNERNIPYAFRICEVNEKNLSRRYRVFANRVILKTEKDEIKGMNKDRFMEYIKDKGWSATEIS